MEQDLIKKQEAFLSELRSQTSESHKALEANSLSAALLAADVSVPIYQAYLTGLFGIVRACEQQVFPMLTHLLADLGKRKKSDLIYKDLNQTGMTGTNIALIPAHHFHELTIPQSLGIMYVLEGSTLGGRILYKHVQEKLGLTHETGAAYFWGYGTETGIMWKIFLSALSRDAVAKNCQQEIIDSAIQAFQLIDNLLIEAAVLHSDED